MTQGIPNPYGTDLQSVPDADGIIDLDPAMLEGWGRLLLAQSIVRRFTTGRGSVIDAPNDCLDLRDYLSEGFTQAQINQIPGQLKKEAEKDERLVSADIQASYDQASKTLTITMDLESAYGPFSLTLSVNAVTVDVLMQGV